MMAASELHPRVLYVEGKYDKFVLAEILEKNGVEWPRRNPPIWIEEIHPSTQNLITTAEVDRKLQRRLRDTWKQREFEALGIVVDADQDANAAWQRVQGWTQTLNLVLPATIASVTGFHHTHSDGRRFGAWVMPDNQGPGMLETWLASLIREEARPLFDWTPDVLQQAKTRGATFREVHYDKARVHCWLSWQDPPGEQLHHSVQNELLDAKCASAAPFVAWAKRLFGV
jgi:hypothetical protein